MFRSWLINTIGTSFSIYIPTLLLLFRRKRGFLPGRHTHAHLSLAFPLTLEISVPFRPTNCFFDRRPTLPPLPPTKFQQTRHYFSLDGLADKRNREYFSSELHGPRFAETSRSGGNTSSVGNYKRSHANYRDSDVYRSIGGTCYTREEGTRRRRRRPGVKILFLIAH